MRVRRHWRHQIVRHPTGDTDRGGTPPAPAALPLLQGATRAVLPADVESGGYGPRLTALVGTLGSTYHLSHHKIQRLLDEAFGVRISTGGISCIRRRLNSLLEQPVDEAHLWLQGQPILQADETSYPVGNADGNNAEGRSGWLWVLRNESVTVFELRSQPLQSGHPAYDCLPLEQRQFCWAHIRRDLIAMAQRSGVSADIGQTLLRLQGQLF